MSETIRSKDRKMHIAIIIMILLLGGLSFYVGSRILQWLTFLFPYIIRPVFIGIYIFFMLSLILGFLPLPSAIKGIMSWISAHWLGVFVYLLMFFIAADLILFIGRIVKLIPANMFPNIRFYFGTAAIILTVGITSYGLYNANQTKTVAYDVQINKSLSGEIKIVLISDLHLGSENSENRLGGIVRGINSLNPDIVCIVGDIFNDSYDSVRDPQAASTLFRSIESTYGVYACLGNHDGGRTLDKMMDFLEESGVVLLKDEYTVIDERLVLVGRLDSSPIGGSGGLRRKDFREIIAQADLDLPVVVMDHNPAHIGQYGKEVDLIISGHTHRGQLFPVNLIVKRLYVVDYGYYRKDADSPQCIVTQGVGTWMMPMRIGTNNEIVSVKIT